MIKWKPQTEIDEEKRIEEMKRIEEERKRKELENAPNKIKELQSEVDFQLMVTEQQEIQIKSQKSDIDYLTMIIEGA